MRKSLPASEKRTKKRSKGKMINQELILKLMELPRDAKVRISHETLWDENNIEIWYENDIINLSPFKDGE